jgi:hypothetical protein
MSGDTADDASDVGLDVLWQVFSNLRIDREWAVRFDRGFGWWPHTLRQNIWVTRAYDSEGFAIHRLCAETEIVTLPDLDLNEVTRRLGRFVTGGGATVHDPVKRVVRFFCSMIVNEEQADWVSRAFATYAILQAVDAHERAQSLARLMEGSVIISEHPNGARAVPDELLATVVDEVIRAKGDSPSPWMHSPEFALVRDWILRSEATAEVHDWGVTAEFPFDGDTVRFEARADMPDPTLGAGVKLELAVPLSGTQDDAARLTDKFNCFEAGMGIDFHFVGRWQPVQRNGEWQPGYVAFIPAVLHQPSVLFNLSFPVMYRIPWVARLLSMGRDFKGQ